MSSQTKWLGKASLDGLYITSGEGDAAGGKRRACNNLPNPSHCHGQEVHVDRLSPVSKFIKKDFPDIRVFKKGSKIAKSCEEPS